MKSVLKLEPQRDLGDSVEIAATLTGPARSHRLWWRLPISWRHALTPWADPFVVGLLFPMLEDKLPVHIEGRVSPSLLENLETYVAIWSCWSKNYKPLTVTADQEIELPPPRTQSVIAPFSGGVDSCYTHLRHWNKEAGRHTRDLGAAAVMDGFDIWPNEPNAEKVWQGILRGTRDQLAVTGIPEITLCSNFHELPVTWAHAFGTHLISGLMLFAAEFHGTVIPNNQRFTQQLRPWGSTPLTDRYLGSTRFPVMDDAGEVSRVDKLAYIAKWPEVFNHLRVCFPVNAGEKNCGTCEKCLRNMLACKVAGVPIPKPAFPKDPTLRQIAGMKFDSDLTIELWSDMLRVARERNLLDQPWAKAIQLAIRRGNRRARWQKAKKPFIPLRNKIRTLVRGTAKSKSQLRKGNP